MKYFRNIKLKSKLLLLGFVSIFGLVAIGLASIITSRQINQASTDISQSWLPSVIIAEELNTAISDYRIKEYNHVVSEDADIMQNLEGELKELQQKIEDGFSQYEHYITSDQDMNLMKQAKECWDQYLKCSGEILAISRRNETDEARRLIISESEKLFEQSNQLFLEVVEFNKQGAENASIHGDRLYVRLTGTKVISICLIGAVIAALVLGIIRAIEKPVESILEGTRRVSNGDLSVSLEYQSDDEIGVLTDSVNALIVRLKKIIDDEKFMLREIGCENYEVKSSCETAYRGDFAPILYSIESLKNRLNTSRGTKEVKRRGRLPKKPAESIERIVVEKDYRHVMDYGIQKRDCMKQAEAVKAQPGEDSLAGQPLDVTTNAAKAAEEKPADAKGQEKQGLTKNQFEKKARKNREETGKNKDAGFHTNKRTPKTTKRVHEKDSGIKVDAPDQKS